MIVEYKVHCVYTMYFIIYILYLIFTICTICFIKKKSLRMTIYHRSSVEKLKLLVVSLIILYISPFQNIL